MLKVTMADHPYTLPLVTVDAAVPGVMMVESLTTLTAIAVAATTTTKSLSVDAIRTPEEDATGIDTMSQVKVAILRVMLGAIAAKPWGLIDSMAKITNWRYMMTEGKVVELHMGEVQGLRQTHRETPGTFQTAADSLIRGTKAATGVAHQLDPCLIPIQHLCFTGSPRIARHHGHSIAATTATIVGILRVIILLRTTLLHAILQEVIHIHLARTIHHATIHHHAIIHHLATRHTIRTVIMSRQCLLQGEALLLLTLAV